MKYEETLRTKQKVQQQSIPENTYFYLLGYLFLILNSLLRLLAFTFTLICKIRLESLCFIF